MKLSYSNKIRFIIIFLFFLALLSGIIVISQIHSSINYSEMILEKNKDKDEIVIDRKDLDEVTTNYNDIESTIYIILLVQFVVTLILIFNLTNFLKQALSNIHKILEDISKGNYNIDIDISTYKERLDQEFVDIIISIKNALIIFRRFDELKKEKIVEQKNRLKTLLNIAENGFIITSMNGDIMYINQPVKDVFSSLNEETNLYDDSFVPEIEKSIKKYVISTLENKSHIDTQKYFIATLKRHITIKGSIVRNRNGDAVGAVFCLPILEKKKTDKKEKSTKANDSKNKN